MTDLIYVGDAFQTIDTAPALEPITRVIIKVSDNVKYTQGDESGRTLEFENPFGTPTMCAAVLTQVRNFVYQPYSCRYVLLDPLAELGDGVQIEGVYSGIYSLDMSFGTAPVADISAPADEEINHEYPIPTMAKKVKKAVETVHGMSSYVDALGERVGETESNVQLMANSVNGLNTAMAGISAIADDAQAKVNMIATFTTGGNGTMTGGTVKEAAVSTWADSRYASAVMYSKDTNGSAKIMSNGTQGTQGYVFVSPGSIVLSIGGANVSLTTIDEQDGGGYGLFLSGINKISGSPEHDCLRLDGVEITSWNDLSHVAVFG